MVRLKRSGNRGKACGSTASASTGQPENVMKERGSTDVRPSLVPRKKNCGPEVVRKTEVKTQRPHQSKTSKARRNAALDALASSAGASIGDSNFQKLMVQSAGRSGAPSSTTKRTKNKAQKPASGGAATRKNNDGPKGTRATSSTSFSAHDFVALDCEMVEDTDGKNILARLSLVNAELNCLFDCLVRPAFNDFDKIHDYRTHITGITKQSFESRKSVSQKQANEKVKEVLWSLWNRAPATRRGSLDLRRGRVVLVGHAVKNDLDVLQFKYERVGAGDHVRGPSTTDEEDAVNYKRGQHEALLQDVPDASYVLRLPDPVGGGGGASGNKEILVPVIDTQFLYREAGGKGNPKGLQALAWSEFRERIQGGTHDSVVDARTTMRLLKKKLMAP